MEKEKSRSANGRDILPEEFHSISEAANFWDTHDSIDYEDMMKDVDFHVEIKRRVYLVPIAGEVLDALQKKARAQGLSTETIANLLLREHMA